jgi:hypothetical protein
MVLLDEVVEGSARPQMGCRAEMTLLLQDAQGGRIGRIPVHDYGFREIVVGPQDCFFQEQFGRKGIPAGAQ